MKLKWIVEWITMSLAINLKCIYSLSSDRIELASTDDKDKLQTQLKLGNRLFEFKITQNKLKLYYKQKILLFNFSSFWMTYDGMKMLLHEI